MEVGCVVDCSTCNGFEACFHECALEVMLFRKLLSMTDYVRVHIIGDFSFISGKNPDRIVQELGSSCTKTIFRE